MTEQRLAIGEGESIKGFVGQLREALAVEVAAGTCDLARWGEFSHDWNKAQRAFLAGLRTCIVRSRLHRQVHRAAFQLFPAWQEIHYTLSYKRPAKMDGLDALERDLEEVLRQCQ